MLVVLESELKPYAALRSVTVARRQRARLERIHYERKLQPLVEESRAAAMHRPLPPPPPDNNADGGGGGHDDEASSETKEVRRDRR